ncbi:carbohydrate sulfotransferase 3-like isoform X2 [Haemaphysalis longicornis]
MWGRAFMAKWRPFVFVGAGVFVFIFYLGFAWRILDPLLPSRNYLPEEFSEKSLEGGANQRGDTASNLIETETWDSSLEGKLPAAFERALKTYSAVAQADVKIVLLVAYYRSGSTFVGELLSSGARTFYHFEPLMPFTVSGRIRPGRQRHAFELLDELVRCRMQNVPLYTVWLENHIEYVEKNHFLAEVCEGGQSCTSPAHMAALCSRAEQQVLKFTRLYVSQVADWIERNPDIAPAVQVVHLVRDPRAVYSSRRGLRWCTDNEACDSAEALCAQMRSDLDSFEELAKRMQPNRTIRLRFEDLAADPENEAPQLFRYLGLNYTTAVSQYVKSHTRATFRDLRNAHSTKRNPHRVAVEWKRKLSNGTIHAIERACSDVLLRLNYELLTLSEKGQIPAPAWFKG